jgi:hypothetical protein
VIQLTRSGLVAGCEEEVETLREEFDNHHCVRLRQLLAPELLRLVQLQIAGTEFHERTYHASVNPPPVALSMSAGGTAFALLRFLVNNHQLFHVVRQITGIGRIGCVEGEVYRMVPGLGHSDCWHDDLGRGRMLSMAINLSTETYCGGVLQIREVETGRIVHEVANTGFGDAVLFRIGPHLEHRVTPVEGAAARTVFAAWFFAEPDYRSWYQKDLAAPI